MPGTPPTVAQETFQAQETPFQTWLSGWLEYLSDNLPMIFIVVAVLAGILALVKGGVKHALIFAAGAALAFLLLTNLEAIAEFFSDELPIPDAPEADAPEVPEAEAEAESGSD